MGLKTGSSLHIWSSALEIDFGSLGMGVFMEISAMLQWQCFQAYKMLLVNLACRGCTLQQALQLL